MQLIAGRSGQEYNQRKGRHGAFWEDHYHATSIDADEHCSVVLFISIWFAPKWLYITRLVDQPEVERRVKISDLTVTGTTCDTPMGLPMSM